jgi:hypothetical protein
MPSYKKCSRNTHLTSMYVLYSSTEDIRRSSAHLVEFPPWLGSLMTMASPGGATTALAVPPADISGKRKPLSPAIPQQGTGLTVTSSAFACICQKSLNMCVQITEYASQYFSQDPLDWFADSISHQRKPWRSARRTCLSSSSLSCTERGLQQTSPWCGSPNGQGGTWQHTQSGRTRPS